MTTLGLIFAAAVKSTIDCAPVGNYACPSPFLAGGDPAGKGGVTTFPDQASAALSTSAYIPDVKSPKSINWTLGIEHASKRLHVGSPLSRGSRNSFADAEQLTDQAQVNYWYICRRN